MPLNFREGATIEEMDAELARYKQELRTEHKRIDEFWDTCPEPWKSVGKKLASTCGLYRDCLDGLGVRIDFRN